ncbi:MAG: nitroreductase family protein [Chloroflexi bacterium]|nr:nitroreductase family protein [Chloroflexota bacterium]
MTSQTTDTPSIPTAGMDVLEAIYTTRAMRRVKPDPIPDDVLRAIMDAAIRAPSGGNSQGWAFIVVRDQALRQGLADIYRPCIARLFEPDSVYMKLARSEDPEVASQTQSMIKSAGWLGEHMQDAPVIVVPCIHTGGRTPDFSAGSSVYPAVQNLMIAARAFGVGTTLTTIHRLRQDEVRTLLGIPSTVETAALIPMGYPTGRWGVGKRKPLEQVVFGDRWEQPFGS